MRHHYSLLSLKNHGNQNMFKKAFSLFFVITLSITSVCAKIATKTETFTGVGKTQSLALQDALVNVISKTNPTLVRSLRASYNGEMGGTFFKSPKYGQWDTSKTAATTDGKIQSYKIIKQSQDHLLDKLWHVTIQAEIATYSSSFQKQSQTKHTLAVLPFQLNPGALDTNVHFETPHALLTQSILNNLSGDQHILLVDRTHSDFKDYEKEIRLIDSKNAAPNQRARLSNIIGADYFLTGNISQLTFKKIKRTYYGTSFDQWRAAVHINYRLVEVATMGIIASHEASASISNKTINEMLHNHETLKEVEHLLFKRVADAVSQQVKADLQPNK